MKSGLRRSDCAWRLLLVVGFLLSVTTSSLAQESAGQRAAANQTIAPSLKEPDASAMIERAEIELLKAQLAAQQEQIDQIRKLLEAQTKLIESGLLARDDPGRTTNPPVVVPPSSFVATPTSNSTVKASQAPATDDTKPSPLRFRIGTVDITPVGFIDLTAVVRDRNLGSGIGSNYGGVPYNNTVAGNLRESQVSSQNSRFGARFDTVAKGWKVLGYFETDFLGIVPGNVAVTANSDTLRLRLAWADLRKDKIEVLGGQSWSLLTPNRKGLSPLPADVFTTQVLDANPHLGLTWTRSPGLRFVYHARENIQLGVSLEASEQYGGGTSGSGAITLPKNLATFYSGQLNTGSGNLGTPNPNQDLVTKMAFDWNAWKRPLHLEVAGIMTRTGFYNPLTDRHHRAVGGGGSINFNFEVVKNLHLIVNTFYSDGAGRYIFGQGPDLIIKGDGSPSLVRSASTVSGLEYQATPTLALYSYYGGAYYQKNIAIDPADGKQVGFGYVGSPSSHNRSVQQGTAGFSHVLWRDPSYGGLQWGIQYSYLVRHPWYVVPGQPGSAHLNMFFLNLRYLFPGSPPPDQKSQ